MRQQGVVVTGKGLICSAGATVDQSVSAFLDGRSCLHPIPDTRLTAQYGPHNAGLIQQLTPVQHSTTLTSVIDRYVQLAMIAVQEALLNNDTIKKNPEKTGIIIGTCSGPMNTLEGIYDASIRGETFTGETDILASQYYSAALILAEKFRIKGPAFTVTTACSAFTAAVGIASDLIRIGLLDTVIVAGSDAFSATTQAGFNGLKATCKDELCAPFSKPVGLNLGEGAGCVILENKEAVAKRNAPIAGEILGYGLSNDAYHCSAPDPAGKGAALAMQRALENAGVSPDQICYINAHGTGTDANDKAETKAIRRVFGEHADSLKVSSIKSVTGHCLGAAGAVETVASLSCIEKGLLPPTAHFSEARDGCTLDYIPKPGVEWVPGSIMLKNNFAFGGNNASVCISDGKSSHLYPEKELVDDPICISSIGLVTTAGFGLDSLRENLSPSTVQYQVNGSIVNVAHVQDFNMASIDRRIDTKGVDKEAKHAVAAASMALSGAKISDKVKMKQDLGFVMNIAHGSTWAESEHIVPLLKNDFKLEQINAFPYIVPNSLTGTICRTLSLTGYNSTFCNGPGASLTGLMLAWTAIKNNHANAILCGSSDFYSKSLTDCLYADRMHPGDCVIGEGAAMVVIERLSSAAARGVEPLCSIVSANSCVIINDGQAGRNLQSLILDSIASAGIKPSEIGLICGSLTENHKNSIEKIVGKVSFIDISSVTGYASSSQPLFNLAASIARSSLAGDENKKYILAVSSVHNGNNCVMILKKYS